MTRTPLILLFVAVASGSAQEAVPAPPGPFRPTTANLAAWRDHVLPTEAERAFERIEWLSSFGAGMAEARRRKRPLLFYAMNGHPLGCT